MKKNLSLILILIMVLTLPASAGGVSFDAIENYLKTTVSEPSFGMVGGEWLIIGLARNGSDNDEYFNKYYSNLKEYVKASDGILHKRKYTEYARSVLAVKAIGKNPENVCGYDLTKPLFDYEKAVVQGINGAIWALIALDCGEYGEVEIRNKYISHILEREKVSGGWALSDKAKEGDADITAMVLIALSPYRKDEKINNAVERGIDFLSSIQKDNGGFESFNTAASESAAQVLTALSTLGIASSDERFNKSGNSVKDAMLDFYNENGSFSHSGEESLMATEQCFYALVAEKRMKEGKTSLFNMSDVVKNMENEAEETKIMKLPEIKYEGKTFADIKNHSYKKEIEALASRGIINGKTTDAFEPEATMTRAEFATITVNALGLSSDEKSAFSDVCENNWFYGYVNTAFSYGIIKGISADKFNPQGIITREEAAVMVSRAAELIGLNTKYDSSYSRDILCVFDDYTKASDWAVSSLAFCYDKEILDGNVLKIKPGEAVTRGEIAFMIYNMLAETGAEI